MSEEMLSEGVRYPHYPQALLDINGGEGKKKKKNVMSFLIQLAQFFQGPGLT